MTTVYSHALPALQEELPYGGPDSTGYSLGQDFTVLANTVIYGVRVWNPGQRAVPRNLRIYNTNTSTIWQTLSTPNTLAPGWNEFLLATPVTFLVGTTYTVSMNVQGATAGVADEHYNDYGAKAAYLVGNVDSGNIRMKAAGGTFIASFDQNTQAAGSFNNSYYGFDLLHTPVSITAPEAVKVQETSNRAAATTSLAVTFGAAAKAKNHIFIAVCSAATVNTPTGFTLIESSVNSAGLYLFVKQAVGGETTVNVIPTSNATTLAYMWEVSGLVDAAAATIKDGSANAIYNLTNNGVYGNVSGATATQADTYQVGLFGGQINISATAVDPGTTLGQLYGFNQLFDGAQSATPGNMMQVAARHSHTTGAKGFTAGHGTGSGPGNSILTANFKVAPLAIVPITIDAVSTVASLVNAASGTTATGTINIGASASLALIFVTVAKYANESDSNVVVGPITLGGVTATRVLGGAAKKQSGSDANQWGYTDIYAVQNPPTGLGKVLSWAPTCTLNTIEAAMTCVTYKAGTRSVFPVSAHVANGQNVASVAASTVLTADQMLVGIAANGSNTPVATVGTSDIGFDGSNFTAVCDWRIAHNTGVGSTSLTFSTDAGDFSCLSALKIAAGFSEPFVDSTALTRFLPSRFRTTWLGEGAGGDGQDTTSAWGPSVPLDIRVASGKLEIESGMQNYGESKLLSEGLWDLTGTVEFDQNGSTNSEGSSVIYFTDRPYAFLSYDGDNANGPKPANGFSVNLKVPICHIWTDYAQIDWYQNANTTTQDPGSAQPPSGVVVNGTEQHWKIEIIGGKVYVTVAGTQATPAFNVPVGLPNPCWVHIAVHNHASVKYTAVPTVTGKFDNLVYSAPSLARFAKVADSGTVQFGWHLETQGGTTPVTHSTSPLSLGSPTHAWLLFNIGGYGLDFDAASRVQYSLNGNTVHSVPLQIAGHTLHGVFSVVIPVLTSEVVNGINTVTITATGFANAAFTRYANVEIVLDDLVATAPGAPTGITPTAGNAQVALTWSAPTDGGSAITNYEVDWALASAPTSWLGPVATGSTTAAYTKTGLTNGTAYVFRVRAINAIGTGSYSATSSSVTPVAPVVTGAVARLLEGTAGARLLQSDTVSFLEGAAAAAALYSDNFDRADGALTTPWVIVDGTLSISGNKVLGRAGNLDTARYNQTFAADQWVEANLSSQVMNVSICGPMLRVTPGGDFYYFWMQTGAPTGIFKRVSGTYSQVGASGAAPPSSAFKCRMEAQGTTLRLYINDVLWLTVTDSSITTGQPGILGNGPGVLDNWRGGDLPYVPIDFGKFYKDLSPGANSTVFPLSPITVTAGALVAVQVSAQYTNSGGAGSTINFTVTDDIGDTGGTAWTSQGISDAGVKGVGSYMARVETFTRKIGTTPGAAKTITVTGSTSVGNVQTSQGGQMWINPVQIVSANPSVVHTTGTGTFSAGGSTTYPQTLNGVPLANSFVLSCVQDYWDQNAMTPPSGFIPLQQTSGAGGAAHASAYMVGALQTFNWGVVTTDKYMGVAIEIAV